MPKPTPRDCATGSSGQRSAGRSVLGYGAASRAVALLCRAGVDRRLLPAIVDTSPSKHGLRMPGTDIPIVSPAKLATHPPARGAPLRAGSAHRGSQGLSRGRRLWRRVGGCGSTPRMTAYQHEGTALVQTAVELPSDDCPTQRRWIPHDQTTGSRLQTRLLGRREHEVHPTASSDAQGGACRQSSGSREGLSAARRRMWSRDTRPTTRAEHAVLRDRHRDTGTVTEPEGMRHSAGADQLRRGAVRPDRGPRALRVPRR